MDDGILLFHGSKEEVIYPEIRITRYTKDFSWGFYCTKSYQQAYRWADRRSADGIVKRLSLPGKSCVEDFALPGNVR